MPESNEQVAGAVPWWCSRPPGSPAPGSSPPGSAPGLSGLLAGMQGVMAWARDQLAPHAEHADPADYPQCLACRGQLVLSGLLGGEQDPGAGSGPFGVPVPEPVRVQWIELDPPAVRVDPDPGLG